MIYESILIKSSYITIYLKCIFMLLAIQNYLDLDFINSKLKGDAYLTSK